MGCQGSRHENIDAQVIYEEEKKLGYFNKSAKDVNIAFHKIHGTDTLTQKQLDFCLKAGELQGFDLKSENKQDEKLISFYKNFQKDQNQQNYDLFKLNIAGIILSQGDKVEKARLIFENLDRSLSDNLTKQQFLQNYAEIAINLTTDWLIKLANKESKKQIDSTQIWGQVSPDIIGQQVFEQNDSYKYELFISRVEKMESDWFSTFGIREALLKAHNQKNAEKPVKSSPEGDKKPDAASTEKKEEKTGSK